MNHFLQKSRRKRKVLVVDDEQINRELLEAILGLNYEVYCASCGAEAMDILRENKEAFSLILLDILMPNMNGFAVIEACKADDVIRNIPIIVMTSEKSAEVRSIKMGADDFIAKPYRMPEVILARCERIIELNEEKRLIRSIEADPVTGLYIKLFFDAYINRVLPDLRREMDAVAVRVDGLDAHSKEEADGVLKKVADLLKENFIQSKGIGCRRGDGLLCVFCTHREDHEELIRNIAADLAADRRASGVRLRAGVRPRVDKTAPIDSWFDQAIAALETVPENGESLTAKYTD